MTKEYGNRIVMIDHLKETLDKIQNTTASLEDSWNTMGDLSKKNSSDLSFDELKCKAADLSCELFQQSVKQTNLISQAMNTPDIEQGLAETLSSIKNNSEIIFTETKELATKSDVDEGVIYGLGEWQAIAEESGNFNARAEYKKSLWDKIKIEATSEKISSASADFDGRDFLTSALDKVVTAAKQYSAITDTMFALVDNDPRELVIATVKSGLADAVTESFPSLNSITAHLSEALSINGIADDIANTLGEYNDFSKASIDSIKEFASNKLTETITSEVLDAFDLQNKAAFDGGSLQGIANSLFGMAESFQIGDDFPSLEDAVDNLKQSASGVLGSAEDLISLSTSSINDVSVEDLKGSLSDTFSESFSPLNSVTCFASQLCEFDDVPNNLKSSFENIAATTKDAVATVKSAVTEIEFPQDALDTFDGMQEVSASSGKLFAYGESILELADSAYEAAGDNESLLGEVDQIVQGAQDLLDSANTLLDMTQQDPRELVLDELNSRVSSESENLAGSMANISDSTSNAIASGLLDETLTQTFDKIKENVAKAESSQAELKSSAKSSSKSESDQAADTGKTGEDKADQSRSDKTEAPQTNAADEQSQASSADNKASESTAAVAEAEPSSENANDSNESNKTAANSIDNAEEGSKAETASKGDSKPGKDTNIESDTKEDNKSYADTADKADSPKTEASETKSSETTPTAEAKADNSYDTNTSSDSSVADNSNNSDFNTDNVKDNSNSKDDSFASESDDKGFFGKDTKESDDSQSSNQGSFADNLTDTDKADANNDKSKLSDLI